MTNDEILEAFADAPVRIEEVFYIPGTFNAHPTSDEAVRFIEDAYDNDDLRAVCPALKYFDDGGPSTEEILEDGISEEIGKLPGFFVKAASPMRRFWPGGGVSYSWGAVHTRWFYCANEAAIAPTVLAWARKIEATVPAKAA